MFHSTFSKLSILCDIIAKLALLNILFIFFSCAGLIIFGVSPAFSAMTFIIKKLYEKEDVPIIKTFYKSFKHEVIQSNKFGLLYNYFFILLLINLLLSQTLPEKFQTIGITIILLFGSILALSMLYIYPLYVTFEVSMGQLIKNSFKMIVAFLPKTIVLVIAVLLIGFICYLQPILIILFAFSSISALTLLISQQCFKKMQTAV